MDKTDVESNLMSNPAKCQPEDYIQALIASPNGCSATEAANIDPREDVSHDAYSRLLLRYTPSTEQLWEEVKVYVKKEGGVLVIDDATLDKPYAKDMDLVGYYWSGKHHATVKGINLVSLLWSDGDQYLPCDYRVVEPQSEEKLTKNDLFQQMIRTAYNRGFKPEIVCFDTWYSSLDNLKLIQSYGWIWLTRLKSNRIVSSEKGVYCALQDLQIGDEGRQVHLKGYGFIRVFRTVDKDGDVKYWATNHLEMDDLQRIGYVSKSWTIEEYHRGIKQFCGIEKCQATSRLAQLNHIGFAIRAFLRLERHCWKKGISWFEAKKRIIRDALRQYLSKPIYILPAIA